MYNFSEINQEMSKTLTKLGFLKEGKFNQELTYKKFEQLTQEQQNFLTEIYNTYSITQKYKLSELVYALERTPENFDELNNLVCPVPECQEHRKWIPTKMAIAYGCNQHIKEKHPVVKELQKVNRTANTKKNLKKKYGVENVSQLESVKKKKEETALKNYGVKNPLQSREVQEKLKQTCLEKYGVSNPRQAEEIKRKAEQTCLQKYGVKNHTQNKTWMKNHLKKMHKSKGYFYPRQSHLKNLENLNKNFIQENFIDENNYFLLNDFMEYFGYTDSTEPYKYMKKFGIQYTKINRVSRAEKELLNYIKSLYDGDIIENSQEIISPLELDIYIPEKNLAIEFNGIYWHSIGIQDYEQENIQKIQKLKKLHKLKSDKCEEQGINLFHIFEYDWNHPKRKEIIKSQIKYKLDKIDKKYYARNCYIKEIDSTLSSRFLENNHIQGNSPSSIKLGLFDKKTNELVSVMTFGKSRYNKNIEYELIRFASKINTVVIGAGSKLFQYFVKKYNPVSVVSYANRNFSSTFDNIYKTLGFQFIKNNKGNLIFIKPGPINEYSVINRQSLTKKKLIHLKEKNIIEIPDEDINKSANYILLKNKYRILYGPGNGTYIWHNSN